jgi:hypothetical protein
LPLDPTADAALVRPLVLRAAKSFDEVGYALNETGNPSVERA